ncbi:small subunit ribosomal protein S20 [Paenibacillus sp. JGP012]|jgi:small subunit ribosomal protein S20|uniref:Small ribosomal subunit protein bS20 n=5 Tax=Paenibacillus TaxID=44249 RepID=A0A2V4WIX2_PAEBA|nr:MULTISPECIES: 30S ribosomal protein S20 [Paenibacillus]KAA8782728.1 30S ribosomal protein S20 [Paenibacillus amylolyticus]MBB6020482.1 small subunit ribosomal protein S20 [Paenibacillus sp. JGP012]MBU5354157.1 30S ribosomal protein S20 [Paenibacillus barcinonensis]MCK6075407.1 30S ribosomal protein S20 [Paenibacillus silvae]MCK6149794.1 30S ribosomal protein S20 [Paenibacillus silvae]
MPNIKSAVKRVKTSDKRRALNASQKSALRTAVKAADAALVSNEVETAKAAIQAASKKLDKAVTKGLVHKNAAARKKSRLAKKLNALSAQA